MFNGPLMHIPDVEHPLFHCSASDSNVSCSKVIALNNFI